jgi:F-box/WD-40 domain protein MET30
MISAKLMLDRTIKVWDRESGNCEQTLVGHRGAVTSLQLSDDMIVSGSGELHAWVGWSVKLMADDGDVMIWNFGPTVTGQSVGIEQKKPKEKPVGA